MDVRVALQKTTTSAQGLSFTTGDISGLLPSALGQFAIVQVSAYSKPGDDRVFVTAKTSNLMDGGVTANQEISKADYGTYSRRPGVKFSVPTSRLKYYARDTAGSVDLFSINPGANGSALAVITVRALLQYA